MGILEKLVADMADIQTSLSILIERSGLAAGKDKPASEKALEQVASGRRGAATTEEAADKPTGRRTRTPAAADKATDKGADKPKKLTAAAFDKLLEEAFQVEEVKAYADLGLTKEDFDAVYEDLGKALQAILDYLNVKSVKDVKVAEDQQLVLTFLKLAEQTVVDNVDMPGVNDVLDAIEAESSAPEPEAAPARRGRR